MLRISSSPEFGAGAARPGSVARVPGPALTAGAGVLAAGVTVVVVGDSEVLDQPALSAAVRGGFVLAAVAGGAYTWWRRPGSGFGPLFALAGLLFALTSLNALAAPLAFTLGRVAYAAVMFALVYVCLCFPRGRLGSSRDRRFVTVLAAVTAFVWVIVLALAAELPPGGPFTACIDDCPHNALRVIDGAAEAGRVMGVVANIVTVVSFVAATALLLLRMRESDRAARRTLTPLFVALSAILVSLAAYTLARLIFDAHPVVLSAAVAVAVLLLPAAILAGQVRGRLFAARRLGSLVADVVRRAGDRAGRAAPGRRCARRPDAARWRAGTRCRRPIATSTAARSPPGARAWSSRATGGHMRWCATTPRSTNRPRSCAGPRPRG